MTEYCLENSLNTALAAVVADESFTEFAALRSNDIQFLVAQMVKMDKQEVEQATSGPPVVVRRISPADAVFLEGFHFKVYVCAYRWGLANEEQRRAMLHRALKSINVELKENGLKLSRRKADVETFQDTIRRFGSWEQPLIEVRENLALAMETKARAGRVQGENKKK